MSVSEPNETSLLRVDALLREFRPPSPSAAEILEVRRAMAPERARSGSPEVLTLAEVATFLRIPEHELDRIVDELPAFEFAGRLRVRRRRLLEWIEHRERVYAHSSAAHVVGKGVA